MSAAEILRKAREYLTPEGAWTQGTFARDETKRDVSYAGDEATCFCAAGAIFRASSRTGAGVGPESDALTALRSVVVKLDGGYQGIPFWNDLPGRTQAEVLAAFDAAIAAAEAP